MKRQDFPTALKEADSVLQSAPVPSTVAARLERRLLQPSAVNRWRVGYSWALAAAATCVVALVLVFVKSGGLGLRGATHRAAIGWLEVGHASADLAARADTEHETVFVERGTCTLTDRSLGLTMQSVGPIELRRESGATRVVRGQVAVRVQPRAGLSPVRLLVSHGIIEVVGTYFTVIQRDKRGQVSLHEGKVRFRSPVGKIVELAPGQSLEWPLAEPAEPALTGPEHTEPQLVASAAVAAATPDAGPSAGASATATTVMAPATTRISLVERLEQIQGLRSRGQWARAAEELTDLLRGPLPTATRERLSYELGSIATYQIHDVARACAVWRSHQKGYPQGRYRTEVEQAQRSLGCGESKR